MRVLGEEARTRSHLQNALAVRNVGQETLEPDRVDARESRLLAPEHAVPFNHGAFLFASCRRLNGAQPRL